MSKRSRSSAYSVLWPAVAALLILVLAIRRPRLELRIKRGGQPQDA